MIRLLKKLYAINSPSCKEENIRNFIIKQVKKIAPNALIDVDHVGNVLVTKGRAKNYPCVVAHMDEVHEREKNDKIEIIQTPHLIYGWSEKKGALAGIGADDKNGCWINLMALKEVNAMKCAFFVGEEWGCVGSSAVDLGFFSDCHFILQSDRRNGCDLIYNAAGITLGSKTFFNDLRFKSWGYVKTNGSITDVMTLTERGVGISTVNISSGYYNPHTNSEYTKIAELLRTKDFIIQSMKNLKKTYPYKSPDVWRNRKNNAYNSLQSWNTYDYWNDSKWNDNVSYDYDIGEDWRKNWGNK